MVRDEAQRDKHEHNVRPRPEKEKLVGLNPSRLIFRYAEKADDAFLIREPACMTVSAEAVLEKGRPVGWRHLRQWKMKSRGGGLAGGESGAGGIGGGEVEALADGNPGLIKVEYPMGPLLWVKAVWWFNGS